MADIRSLFAMPSTVRTKFKLKYLNWGLTFPVSLGGVPTHLKKWVGLLAVTVMQNNRLGLGIPI